MPSGPGYALNLCLSSPEESESVSLPNTDIAQRPRDFVNGGISVPMRSTHEAKPGGDVSREHPLCKHPRLSPAIGVLLEFFHPGALPGSPRHLAGEEDVALALGPMQQGGCMATRIPLLFNSFATGAEKFCVNFTLFASARSGKCLCFFPPIEVVKGDVWRGRDLPRSHTEARAGSCSMWLLNYLTGEHPCDAARLLQDHSCSAVVWSRRAAETGRWTCGSG